MTNNNLRRGIPALSAVVVGLVGCGEDTIPFVDDVREQDAATRDDAGTGEADASTDDASTDDTTTEADAGDDTSTETDASTGTPDATPGAATAATDEQIASWVEALCAASVECYAGYVTAEECPADQEAFLRDDLATYAALGAECDTLNIAYWNCADDGVCGDDGYLSTDCDDEFAALGAAGCTAADG